MTEKLDFRRVLKDFQYKPNFGFGIYEQDGKWWIRIIMMVEDSRQAFRPWTVEQRSQEEFYGYDIGYRPPVRTIIGYSPSRELVEVVGTYIIPPYVEGPDQEQMFVQWLVDMVRDIEDHETFEWLRYKGELINDPHKEK